LRKSFITFRHNVWNNSIHDGLRRRDNITPEKVPSREANIKQPR
jgi:hypothetical protein